MLASLKFSALLLTVFCCVESNASDGDDLFEETQKEKAAISEMFDDTGGDKLTYDGEVDLQSIKAHRIEIEKQELAQEQVIREGNENSMKRRCHCQFNLCLTTSLEQRKDESYKEYLARKDRISDSKRRTASLCKEWKKNSKHETQVSNDSFERRFEMLDRELATEYQRSLDLIKKRKTEKEFEEARARSSLVAKENRAIALEKARQSERDDAQKQSCLEEAAKGIILCGCVQFLELGENQTCSK